MTSSLYEIELARFIRLRNRPPGLFIAKSFLDETYKITWVRWKLYTYEPNKFLRCYFYRLDKRSIRYMQRVTIVMRTANGLDKAVRIKK